MPVTFTWDNPQKTIGLFTFNGRWKWSEYWERHYEVERELTEFPHTVHFIVYIADDVLPNYFPPNILPSVLRVYRNPPVNVGRTVIISGGYLIVRPIYEMIRRLYPHIAERFAFADDLDEARRLLVGDQGP